MLSMRIPVLGLLQSLLESLTGPPVRDGSTATRLTVCISLCNGQMSLNVNPMGTKLDFQYRSLKADTKINGFHNRINVCLVRAAAVCTTTVQITNIRTTYSRFLLENLLEHLSS